MYMKKILLPVIFLCASLMFLSSAAAADAGTRFGVIVQQIDYSEPGADLGFQAVGVILGRDVSNSFGVELRYGQGTEGDTVNGIDVDIDKYASALARLSAPNSSKLTPSFYAGYTKGWLSAPGYGKASSSGFSYGAAIDLKVTREFSIGLEYMSMLDKDTFEADSFGVKATFKI